jgi:hypothetical protein
MKNERKRKRGREREYNKCELHKACFFEFFVCCGFFFLRRLLQGVTLQPKTRDAAGGGSFGGGLVRGIGGRHEWEM